MKKLFAFLLITLMALFSLFPAKAMASSPNITIDGQVLYCDVPPVIQNGRTLVPMRAIFEALNARIQWNGTARIVTARRNNITVQLTIGSTIAYVNKQPVILEVPAGIVSQRTMVPLRFVSEALGAAVDWNAASSTVSISSDYNSQPSAPAGLTATPGNGEVALKWDQSSDNVKGYYVYESTYPDRDFSRITFDDGVEQVTKPDVLIYNCEEGVTLYYYVTAVGENDHESPPSAVVSCTPPVTDPVSVSYEWEFEGHSYTMGPIYFSGSMLKNYQNRPHPQLDLYDPYEYVDTYTADSDDDQVISEIVSGLTSEANKRGISGDELAEFVVAFVQSFPYVSDSISTPSDEYPRYPVETLLQKEGDCEDTAILTAVLLNELGYGSALLYLPDQGHMAVGILGNENVEGSYYEKDGQRYYYLETTAVGWHIGEIPDDCQDADAMVFPLP